MARWKPSISPGLQTQPKPYKLPHLRNSPYAPLSRPLARRQRLSFPPACVGERGWGIEGLQTTVSGELVNRAVEAEAQLVCSNSASRRLRLRTQSDVLNYAPQIKVNDGFSLPRRYPIELYVSRRGLCTYRNRLP